MPITTAATIALTTCWTWPRLKGASCNSTSSRDFTRRGVAPARRGSHFTTHVDGRRRTKALTRALTRRTKRTAWHMRYATAAHRLGPSGELQCHLRMVPIQHPRSLFLAKIDKRQGLAYENAIQQQQVRRRRSPKAWQPHCPNRSKTSRKARANTGRQIWPSAAPPGPALTWPWPNLAKDLATIDELTAAIYVTVTY